MWDFQNFSWTIGGNNNRSLPDIVVSLQVINATTKQIVKDFTGANAFNIWVAFAGLSNADKREVVEDFIWAIIRKRASQ